MTDAAYMQMCIDLASEGLGYTAPNPLVGAIIVHNGQIIGKGFHAFYGGPHAEVNAINDVTHPELLKTSCLYVNLEPCSHYGKTPPCANLIIEKGIPKVVIGSMDPFPEVSGRGIEMLKAAGIDVTIGVLEKECLQLNRRFNTFYQKKKPYIILKWAQTADGYIAPEQQEKGNPLKISNDRADILVHQWRAQEQAILVGKNTVLKDDPLLNVRHVKGKDPILLVLADPQDIPAGYRIWARNPVFLGKGEKGVRELYSFCWQNKIQSVLVEGGANVHQTFIRENLWDEARIIINPELHADAGIPAASIQSVSTEEVEMEGNQIHIYYNTTRE